jgi:D-alanyl-D-alanine endopeptidase (penicillin-binding protein 7)
MLNYFLASAAILSHLLNLSTAEALQANVHVVPTVREATGTSQFSWQVQPNLRTELRPPVLRKYDDKDPQIEAVTALVLDEATGQVLWQKNPDQVVPIASITKLMTALVWFDHQPPAGFGHVHTVAPEQDTPEGKELNLPHGAQLTTHDLLNIALVASNNDTALGLAQSTSLPNTDYVALMNAKARSLGLDTMHFTDATGLSAENVATAEEVARLARAAFAVPALAEAASQPDFSFSTIDGGISRRVYTTNQLLFDDAVEIVAGKTGYTLEAGYCLVVQATVPNSDRTVIAVVLGTDHETARFEQAKKLLLWTYNNYVWN